MDAESLISSRRALHGVAELLLAGPQYRASGTIRLRIEPGGFGTVADPPVLVDGDHLVCGGLRVALDGPSYAEIGARAGLDAGAPAGLYHDGSGVEPDDPVRVDPEAAALLASVFAAGDTALRALDPAQTPVLWPEHFDVGIVLDLVNYGVSPGDGFLAEPYAYVGPHDFDVSAGRYRAGFWNAPFGAAVPVRDLPGDTLRRFFADGRTLVRGHLL
jgi:hypothetical protein